MDISGIVTDPTHAGTDPAYCLTSSCVTVPERLQPSKILGFYKPHIEGKREFENWRSGDVPCNKGAEHIGAKQIFPIINHTAFRTPTVKHHCARTDLSASLRACSNKVKSDPVKFAGYADWFRKEYIPMFVKFLDNEEVKVNMDNWLDSGRYPIKYREKMRQAFKPENLSDFDRKFVYEAFPKIELQFTPTLHTMKETEMNTVKERQICGPSDEKKCLANAFINKMEEIAHKYFKPYCGRKNWQEMCKTIEGAMREIVAILFGAADGSGFDMSQLEEHNELMNELLLACLDHENVVLDAPLTKEGIQRALLDSLILNVTVNHGDLKYTAQGRASGDGWTTFGNTMLMISYYMYTFKIANIEEFFLMVKGDDVLLALSAEDKAKFMDAHAKIFTTGKHEHSHGLAQICTDIKWGPIEEMDFLSNHFFWTNNSRLRMTRIPARVIQTISWSTRLQGVCAKDFDRVQKELCYSKGKCLQAWSQGLPLWETLANKMIELGQPGNATEYNVYADEARTWDNRDDRDAYMIYLSERYGINDVDVKDFESEIKSVNTLNGFIHLDLVDKFYEVAAAA